MRDVGGSSRAVLAIHHVIDVSIKRWNAFSMKSHQMRDEKQPESLGIPKSQFQAQKSALASTSKVPIGKRLEEDGNGKRKRKSNSHDLMNPSQPNKESLTPDQEMELEPDPPPLSSTWWKGSSSSSSISAVKAEEEIVRPDSPVGSDSSVSLSGEG